MHQYPASSSHLNFCYNASSILPTSCVRGVPASALSSWSCNSRTNTYQIQKQFSPNKYVAVAVLHVYIGTVKFKDKLKKIPMVARVSITDYRGRALLDTYVRPTHDVEDYRTAETGLHIASLCTAPSFEEVQQRVAAIIRDKILVGHSLWNFLSVLGLSHPTLETRDMALFLPLRKKLKCRSIVGLSTLMHIFMGRKIGLDYEDSLELARASMDLFRSCEEVYEGIVRSGTWPCDLPPSSYSQYFT